MRQVRFGGVGAWALTLWLLSAPGQAQQPSAAHPELDEQAMAVLQRMAAFLTQAQRFSVMVDTGFDVVQDSGQKRARSPCTLCASLIALATSTSTTSPTT